MLYYQVQGQGPAVVLIHGLFGSHDNLGLLARQLRNHFCVISVDVRNHGQSFHHHYMDYPTMAADLQQLLIHLAIDDYALVGHSMGGKIAMQQALSQPKSVRKLVVLDIAPVTYPARHQAIFAGLKAINLTKLRQRSDADRQLAAYVSEAAVRQFLLKNLQRHEDGHWYWRCNLAALENCYGNIVAAIGPGCYEGPVLFIKGANSDYIQASHRDAIGRLFPHASGKIVANTGHWLHAEKPAVIGKIVSDFLLQQ